MVPYRTFNIWRIFLFYKSFFVAKEGSADYKNASKTWFFDWRVLCGAKNGIAVKNLLNTFICKSVTQF